MSTRAETQPETLQRRRDFLRVQEQGRKYRRGRLMLLVLAALEGKARVGYTVSRRVGNAVVRNRVRRRLRELVRRHPAGLCAGLDHVVVALPAAAGATFAQLHEDLTWLFARARADSTASSG